MLLQKILCWGRDISSIVSEQRARGSKGRHTVTGDGVMPLTQPSCQASHFAGWSWVRFEFSALVKRERREGQGGRKKKTGDKTPANPLTVVRFYSCNVWRLWLINEKSEDPRSSRAVCGTIIYHTFRTFPMPHFIYKYNHLVLITCTPCPILRDCLPHFNSWLVTRVAPFFFFQKILSMCPSRSTFNFTSSKELNCCDIRLTSLILSCPCHPCPCPAWSILHWKHHRFLTFHVSCYQSCLPLPPTISCMPRTSWIAGKHPLPPSFLYHTPVSDFVPSPKICYHFSLSSCFSCWDGAGKWKQSHSTWLYCLPSTIQQGPFPCH